SRSAGGGLELGAPVGRVDALPRPPGRAGDVAEPEAGKRQAEVQRLALGPPLGALLARLEVGLGLAPLALAERVAPLVELRVELGCDGLAALAGRLEEGSPRPLGHCALQRSVREALGRAAQRRALGQGQR